jgi:DNA-binding transcriptional LysR family regulator
MGHLVPLFPDWASRRVTTHFALWPSRRNLAPRIRALLEFLTESVPTQLAEQ